MVAGSPRLMILSQRTTWLIICMYHGEKINIILLSWAGWGTVMVTYIAISLVVSDEHDE